LTSGGDRFLSRWSRLKQDAARATPPVPDSPTPVELAAARAAEDARVAQAAADAAAREAAEAREREAVLARLPKLEDLRVDSDFSSFMHPLVPAPLRSAALARLWLLDPAIRTYEDPARDYAWNWNVPDGAPGGGPPPTAEEVESTLKSLFKRFETEERVADLSAPPSQPPAGQALPHAPDDSEQAEAEGGVSGTPAQTPVAPSVSDPHPVIEPPPTLPSMVDRRDGTDLDDVVPPPRVAEPVVPMRSDGASPAIPAHEPPRRRHGGAIPV
jgi:hypothetical protein